MEAKDRLLTPEQMIPMRHKWEIRDAQDKLSFKAGIKEVVDYFFYEVGIVRLMGCATMDECKSKLPKWQAKLKEWDYDRAG